MNVKALITIAMVGAVSVAVAGVETSTDADNVILNGHDAVAYFTAGTATKGSESFTAEHGGAVYRFASEANRDLFNSNPTKYAPLYGGYCAYGTSVGKKFAVNGKAFEVVNGRLYVNKNESVYDLWIKDKRGNISKADGNWPRIKDKDPNDL